MYFPHLIYHDAIEVVSRTSKDLHRLAIGRAIMAQAILLCRKEEKYAVILTDADLRDILVHRLVYELGGGDRPVQNWLLEKLFNMTETLLMDPNLRAITDSTYPFAG